MPMPATTSGAGICWRSSHLPGLGGGRYRTLVRAFMEQTPSTAALFAGDSEMARLMTAVDWGHTPLGPPDAWPQSLKTSVSIVLGSRYPMFVWWGPQLLNFYNDAPTGSNSTTPPTGSDPKVTL